MAADLATGASDEELMRRLQGGEEAALASLMERWERPVKRFIFRLLGNVTEAEDLAQEVFCRIFTKRMSYRPGAKFSAWCYTIAANLAKNRLRWWQRHPVLSIDAWIKAGGEIADESRSGASAAQAALRQEQILAVQQAVLALPLDLRTALILFEYEEQTTAEIAEALDCTPKAVENRLYRARQLLQRSLFSAA
jgi:RNA polymerase sigma-70 factor (ECF subfamily)